MVFPSLFVLNSMIDAERAPGQASGGAALLSLNDLDFAQVQVADGLLDLGAIAHDHPDEMIGVDESSGGVLEIAGR